MEIYCTFILGIENTENLLHFISKNILSKILSVAYLHIARCKIAIQLVQVLNIIGIIKFN